MGRRSRTRMRRHMATRSLLVPTTIRQQPPPVIKLEWLHILLSIRPTKLELRQRHRNNRQLVERQRQAGVCSSHQLNSSTGPETSHSSSNLQPAGRLEQRVQLVRRSIQMQPTAITGQRQQVGSSEETAFVCSTDIDHRLSPLQSSVAFYRVERSRLMLKLSDSELHSVSW